MWNQHELTATFWILNALCIVLVSIRIYVRMTTVYRPWRELLVLWALAMQIGYSISQIFTYYRFHLYEMFTGVTYEESVQAYDYIWLWKILFINEFVEGTGVVAYQAALLLMYMDLCSRHVFPKIWLLIMVNWALVACALGVTIIFSFFNCTDNPLHFWALWAPESGVCSNLPYLITKMIVNDATEIILYIIPICLVVQLPNLSKGQKVGIAAMFSVGFVNVALFGGATALYISKQLALGGDDNTTRWDETLIATGFEQFGQGLWIPTGLIVVCMPQLRVLSRWKFARKVVASFSNRSVGVATDSVILGSDGASPVEANKVNLADEEKGIAEKISQRVSPTSSSERVN